jgi:hypothetical protein
MNSLANLRRVRKVLRSIVYRRRLVEELPGLEAELIAAVQEYQLRQLAGYRIEVIEGKLYLTKLPREEVKQLRLFREDRSGELDELQLFEEDEARAS